MLDSFYDLVVRFNVIIKIIKHDSATYSRSTVITI